MTEEQFAREMYPRVKRAAKHLSHKFTNRIEFDDLTQIGMIAIVRLYRKHGKAPHVALAGRAAWCQMLDAIRIEIGRSAASSTRKAVSTPQSLSDLPDDYTDDKFNTLSDHRRDADQIERAIDFRRMLAAITDPIHRAVINGVLEGRTLFELGDQLRVCHTRISQLKRCAIERIRERFTA